LGTWAIEQKVTVGTIDNSFVHSRREVKFGVIPKAPETFGYQTLDSWPRTDWRLGRSRATSSSRSSKTSSWADGVRGCGSAAEFAPSGLREHSLESLRSVGNLDILPHLVRTVTPQDMHLLGWCHVPGEKADRTL
jgi:hypothetical protein